MKRHVTIRVDADIPDTMHLTDVAAVALEIVGLGMVAHAKDLNDKDSIIGATGSIEYRVEGHPVSVSWKAGYGRRSKKPGKQT